MKSKRVALATVAGVAVVLGVSSWAWACTNFSTINLSSAIGAPGTEVTVAGKGATANGPVEVRWNSRTGMKLASATADPEGNFSVPVRIPDAGPGVHVVVALDAKKDAARAAFEITGDGAERELVSMAPSRPVSSSGGPGGELVIGVGVLAAGLAVAAGGVAAIVAGRRRAAATR